MTGDVLTVDSAGIKLGTAEGAPAAFGMSFGPGTCPEDDGTVPHLVKVAGERPFLNQREKRTATTARSDSVAATS